MDNLLLSQTSNLELDLNLFTKKTLENNKKITILCILKESRSNREMDGDCRDFSQKQKLWGAGACSGGWVVQSSHMWELWGKGLFWDPTLRLIAPKLATWKHRAFILVIHFLTDFDFLTSPNLALSHFCFLTLDFVRCSRLQQIFPCVTVRVHRAAWLTHI